MSLQGSEAIHQHLVTAPNCPRVGNKLKAAPNPQNTKWNANINVPIKLIRLAQFLTIGYTLHQLGHVCLCTMCILL